MAAMTPEAERYRERLRAMLPELAEKYGVAELGLFGSRVRGDHRPDSDADLAVILDGPIERPFTIKSEIIDDAYDIFLDTGIYIQPWPFEAQSVEHPENDRHSHILRAVLREGVAV